MAEEKNRGGCEHWGSENIKRQNVGSKLSATGCCWWLFEVGFPFRLTSNFLCNQSWPWTSDPNGLCPTCWDYREALWCPTSHASTRFICLFVWQFCCLKLACVGYTEIGLLCLLCAEIRGLDPAWLHPKTQSWPTQEKVISELVPESSEREKKKANKIKARNKLLGERSVNWFRLNSQRNII